MSELTKNQKKETVKDIIKKLHQGLKVEEAKEIFEKEVGSITSMEIAEIEQSLINEGISPGEIKKFCNVHALLFEKSLAEAVSKEESPAHPVHLFKLENREIEKITASIKGLAKNKNQYDIKQFKEELKKLILKLKGIDVHYTRKEQLLFPFLERAGFFGPSKVMWGKDDEVRDFLRGALSNLEELNNQAQTDEYLNKYIHPLVEEVDGMIFKEENILFPASIEKLSVDDWVEILKESDEVGYIYIEKPEETSALIAELKKAVPVEPKIKDSSIISLPTGDLNLKELMYVLNTLPVDITFVDKNNEVKYFSESKDRIFVRARSIIGRKVQNCHPPQSVDRVENIVNSFKEGKRDSVDFWINFKGRLIYIRYFAIRDENKNYLGTLEVTQDITGIKKLEGEKRLLDEKN